MEPAGRGQSRAPVARWWSAQRLDDLRQRLGVGFPPRRSAVTARGCGLAPSVLIASPGRSRAIVVDHHQHAVAPTPDARRPDTAERSRCFPDRCTAEYPARSSWRREDARILSPLIVSHCSCTSSRRWFWGPQRGNDRGRSRYALWRGTSLFVTARAARATSKPYLFSACFSPSVFMISVCLALPC